MLIMLYDTKQIKWLMKVSGNFKFLFNLSYMQTYIGQVAVWLPGFAIIW